MSHLPYDPGCEICVACRRPNTQHRTLKDSERTVPLMVGDYCFPKHSDDSDPLTCLVIRVRPYKLYLCMKVSAKGRDPAVVHRLARFIKEVGLTHFTYRSDREPAILAMFEEACALAGRNGTKYVTPENVAEFITHADLIDDSRPSGTVLAEELSVGDVPHV